MPPWRRFDTFDATALLGEISAPTQILHRLGLPWLPSEVGLRLASEIDGSELVLMEGDYLAPYMGRPGGSRRSNRALSLRRVVGASARAGENYWSASRRSRRWRHAFLAGRSDRAGNRDSRSRSARSDESRDRRHARPQSPNRRAPPDQHLWKNWRPPKGGGHSLRSYSRPRLADSGYLLLLPPSYGRHEGPQDRSFLRRRRGTRHLVCVQRMQLRRCEMTSRTIGPGGTVGRLGLGLVFLYLAFSDFTITEYSTPAWHAFVIGLIVLPVAESPQEKFGALGLRGMQRMEQSRPSSGFAAGAFNRARVRLAAKLHAAGDVTWRSPTGWLLAPATTVGCVVVSRAARRSSITGNRAKAPSERDPDGDA